MSLVAAVLLHAARQSELNSILSEREHVAPARRIHAAHIRDLRNSLKELDALLKKLTWHTIRDKERYEELRYSTATRLSYVLSGQTDKYLSKTEIKEKAYERAVKEEHVARMRREELLKEIEQAEKLEGELKVAGTEHEEAKAKLEELYSKIFHGFTVEFPDDSAVEEVARTNRATYEAMQSQLFAETEAHKLLVEANNALAECLPAVDRAVKVVHSAKHSKLDGYDSSANAKLENTLNLAHRHATRACNFINQARQWSAKINDIDPIQIPGRRQLPSYYPELRSFHHEVRDQVQVLMQTRVVLEKEVVVIFKRINRLKTELPVLEKRVSQSREDLFQLRSTQFMAVLKDTTHFLQAPPSIDDLVSPSTPFSSMDIRPITPPPYTSVAESKYRNNE